jgi:hypothetical protein
MLHAVSEADRIAAKTIRYILQVTVGKQSHSNDDGFVTETQRRYVR